MVGLTGVVLLVTLFFGLRPKGYHFSNDVTWLAKSSGIRFNGYGITYTEPLKDFSFKGVIWYQGESDAVVSEPYYNRFKLMIDSWRKEFSNPDLPFITVQLPRIGNRSNWPVFRSVQSKISQLPHVYITVNIDQGHPTDVHPKEKKVIGERLARKVSSRRYESFSGS